MESLGLLDGSNNYGNYRADENIVPALPMSFTGITSLVAAKQRNEAQDGNCGANAIRGECVDAYNVVTVLNEVPPNAGRDMIRPNISGSDKKLIRFCDLDLSRLPQSDLLRGTDADGLERIRQRWSHSTEVFSMRNYPAGSFSEAGRAYRAHILHHDYGSGMAQAFNNDLFALLSSDNGIEEKKRPWLPW
ncbi:hypothetical protein CAI21_09890 [Alkalilimnicola ehrlichii]|uniref:Uncharacterized protein n=1 Tax=Alkalilimnicola ehrlichii TaxID=351052 RepID=A0A3E0WV73_9GAMM|nr:hypothetical protein [Alkalilimnicola ehrlichii]RFA29368.1 hypothetical protein CAI21_09890 [Alkalilimnicola ehrlichii]RFA36880.1 hypothetical protein CAL65_10215 [Alkalilimnicola ehrlichii]